MNDTSCLGLRAGHGLASTGQRTAPEETAFEESIRLIELPESDSIAVCVDNEAEDLFELGRRIRARFEEATMNGYNWDALILFHVEREDPELMAEIEADPEAGMYSATLRHSPENLVKMRRFETLVRSLVADEEALMRFLAEHRDEIGWD